MSQGSQAELFARSFQSQVARNPGAACLTLPLLQTLGVRQAADPRCASEHTVSHGHIIALLIYCLLEHLVRQGQRQLTGRALLEAFADYTVVLLRFADGSQLWTFPELTTLQAALLTVLDLPSPQVTLVLV